MSTALALDPAQAVHATPGREHVLTVALVPVLLAAEVQELIRSLTPSSERRSISSATMTMVMPPGRTTVHVLMAGSVHPPPSGRIELGQFDVSRSGS